MLETRPVDADEVLDEVLGSLRVRIQESDAEIDRQPLPRVEADPSQLGQVFQNLVANAIKFAKPGHRPRISIRAEEHDDAWLFAVQDQGVGMDAEEQRDAFRMFRQGPGASDEPDGQGIGLAVCKKIVERHGGSIWIDAEPGEGSRICFTLPGASAQEEETGDR